MPKAIRMYEYGGPEVLRWQDFDPGKPEAGEALVRHEGTLSDIFTISRERMPQKLNLSLETPDRNTQLSRRHLRIDPLDRGEASPAGRDSLAVGGRPARMPPPRVPPRDGPGRRSGRGA